MSTQPHVTQQHITSALQNSQLSSVERILYIWPTSTPGVEWHDLLSIFHCVDAALKLNAVDSCVVVDSI